MFGNVLSKNGPLLCGGLSLVGGDDDDTQYTCLLFTDGHWIVRYHLIYPRYYHTSWITPDSKIFLIGGGGDRTTTEYLTDDGGSVKGFSLQTPS